MENEELWGKLHQEDSMHDSKLHSPSAPPAPLHVYSGLPRKGHRPGL